MASRREAAELAWRDVVKSADAVCDEAVGALWRALNYLSAAQLYLRDNVLSSQPLMAPHVKPSPSGHWGVCPPTNLALAVLAPLLRCVSPPMELRVIHGAEHAGPSALAFAYLTGALGAVRPEFTQGAPGLHALVTRFPHSNRVGSSVTSLIPGHIYMGGQLGPALAFACGAVLDEPGRLAVPIIGDGECETGAAAAAWLGARAFQGSGTHGCVLPIVLLNGLRMGGASLLGMMSRAEQIAYFSGLGYHPIMHDKGGIGVLREGLRTAMSHLIPLGTEGRPPLLILTLSKGATGPTAVDGKPVMGTPDVHKTPLRDPRRNATELRVLGTWLASYRPHELLTDAGKPSALVAAALPNPKPSEPQLGSNDRPTPRWEHPVMAAMRSRGLAFGPAITGVLERWPKTGGFRVFSPDELRSNRLTLATGAGGLPSWVTEILNEELCHIWLQGYVDTGRRGVFVSYEAFAVLNASLLHQHLKHRALMKLCGLGPIPSLNYLLTSLGWNNSYSHQNPGLVSALLDRENASVRILTPADAPRAAASLALMLASDDGCNVLIASKHQVPEQPLDTIVEELTLGAAIWPQLSDIGPPDLVLAAAGDVTAREVTLALGQIRRLRPGSRLRYVQINDLSILGDPAQLPHALAPTHFGRLFGRQCPIILAVPCFPGAVRGLLSQRPGVAERAAVLGYRDPGRPLEPAELLRRCGIDRDSLTQLGVRGIDAVQPNVAGRRTARITT